MKKILLSTAVLFATMGSSWACTLDPNTNCFNASLSGKKMDQLDLHGILLSQADMTKADLSKSNLTRANLKDAKLMGANLTGANLSMAMMFFADLTGANLTGTNFTSASLKGVNFTSANLTDTNFTGAKMDEATFGKAVFCRTLMPNGMINSANCPAEKAGSQANDAQLVNGCAIAPRSVCQNASLAEANLGMANLSGAQLYMANLAQANLFKVNLNRANLTEANFARANFAKSAHKAAKEAYELIAADMASFSQPYQIAIANLQSDLENGKRDARQLAGELKTIVPQLNKEEADARELLSSMKAVREILGDSADRMLAEAGDVANENEAAYIRDLTQRLSVIGRALENEPVERLTALATADPSDEVSCARIWPALIEILKDRISVDLLDRDGADLLRDMRDRRAGLESRLHGDEDNVKNQARHVYQAIHSEISSQVRKITVLNRLGERLKFGNVVGIRIRAERRQELLKTLEEFADQRSLFRNLEDERRPLEEVLSEFFRDALDLKMEGKELLDYRTYMDLAIEARRHDRNWTPAASLSGGESVGCGLAISLMLFRSLAERGEVRASDITPLFAIDEMQRLDGDGQKVVAEFCERENIQVVVTAPELSPQYRCTLYALARVFDPRERLIVRGLRGQHDSAKVAAVATLS